MTLDQHDWAIGVVGNLCLLIAPYFVTAFVVWCWRGAKKNTRSILQDTWDSLNAWLLLCKDQLTFNNWATRYDDDGKSKNGDGLAFLPWFCTPTFSGVSKIVEYMIWGGILIIYSSVQTSKACAANAKSSLCTKGVYYFFTDTLMWMVSAVPLMPRPDEESKAWNYLGKEMKINPDTQKALENNTWRSLAGKEFRSTDVFSVLGAIKLASSLIKFFKWMIVDRKAQKEEVQNAQKDDKENPEKVQTEVPTTIFMGKDRNFLGTLAESKDISTSLKKDDHPAWGFVKTLFQVLVLDTTWAILNWDFVWGPVLQLVTYPLFAFIAQCQGGDLPEITWPNGEEFFAVDWFDQAWFHIKSYCGGLWNFPTAFYGVLYYLGQFSVCQDIFYGLMAPFGWAGTKAFDVILAPWFWPIGILMKMYTGDLKENDGETPKRKNKKAKKAKVD